MLFTFFYISHVGGWYVFIAVPGGEAFAIDFVPREKPEVMREVYGFKTPA